MPQKKPAKNNRGEIRQESRTHGRGKAALKETIEDQKAAARGLEGESALLAKIAAMVEPDRSIAKRIHAIVKANAPDLSSTTWYGMPAYANKAGKAVLFFQDKAKFQGEVLNAGLQRHREPRRRRAVGDGLRGEGADACRRGNDRRAHKESGALRKALGRLCRGPGSNRRHMVLQVMFLAMCEFAPERKHDDTWL